MNNLLVTSIIIALISCVILRKVLKVQNDKANIITIGLVIGFIFWKKYYNIENLSIHMPEESIPEEELIPCGKEPNEPLEYTLDHIEEDTGNTGLIYNNNTPGYYLLNDNFYSNDGISYDKALSIIQQSKYNDLLEQHNYNIKWSPHTHIGKARGYMNWENIYE